MNECKNCANVKVCAKSVLALNKFFDQLAEKEQRNIEITECCICKKNDELVDEDGNEKES